MSYPYGGGGYPQQGYPMQGSYPPQQVYPAAAPSYMSMPQPDGGGAYPGGLPYPAQPQPGYPAAQTGYPPAPSGYPPQEQPGYPPASQAQSGYPGGPAPLGFKDDACPSSQSSGYPGGAPPLGFSGATQPGYPDRAPPQPPGDSYGAPTLPTAPAQQDGDAGSGDLPPFQEQVKNLSIGARERKVDKGSATFLSTKARCLRERKLWEDPDFPATNRSISTTKPPRRSIEWKRPGELVRDPRLFVRGASRFDVRQGELGDCWLLAAVAALTNQQKLLEQVVPHDQEFTHEYAGIFRFRFWQYGEWQEVIVDDRLPTYYGKLVYMHSEDKNEFWTPLLEKAYAKLHGSYDALTGGITCDAMEDFTGGFTEMFDFRKEVPHNMFQIMQKAFERGSLMGCSIQPTVRIEEKLSSGLVAGHAYTITSVKQLRPQSRFHLGAIEMVRVRNPWGEAEWNGAWSDGSKEWLLIPQHDRVDIGLTFEEDGEFWMSFTDFTRHFHKIEICNLGPDSPLDPKSYKKRWEANLHKGSWTRRINAGGCRNYPSTFWTNPQYQVKVMSPDENDAEGMGTLLIGLMQKDKRKLSRDLLTIGYTVYRYPDNSSGLMDCDFFNYNRSVASCPAYINLREVSGRHKLRPGNYCVIPSTFEPNEETEFVLRLYTERPSALSQLDDETEEVDESDIPVGPPDKPPPRPLPKPKETKPDERVVISFRTIAGDDMEVDSYELQEVLDNIFKQRFKFEGFSRETCRSMVAMFDKDQSGMLGFTEFCKLVRDLNYWAAAFSKYDIDGKGYFVSYDLRRLFLLVGYRVSNHTFTAIVQRYSDKDGRIMFDDFIMCTVRLATMLAKWEETETRRKPGFTLDEFLHTTMYS